jgi:hypothetical protein
LLLAVAFCAASALGRAAYAQAKDEKKPAEKPAAAQPPAAKPAEKPATAAKPADAHAAPGGPDMAKMMEAWKKSATPGEYHAKLNPLVGKWTFVTKMRMSPDQPWEETPGKAEYRWALGKRVLFHDVKANPGPKDAEMGGPFEGFGFTGFDNGTQKYFNIWTDNMSTTYMASTGSVDSSGKTFTYTSEDGYICPMTGEKKTPKSVLKIAGDDKLVFEMYDKGPDGKEFMSLEVTYTRQK